MGMFSWGEGEGYLMGVKGRLGVTAILSELPPPKFDYAGISIIIIIIIIPFSPSTCIDTPPQMQKESRENFFLSPRKIVL